MASLLRKAAPDGSVSISPAEAGWAYISFTARRLKAGEAVKGETGGNETALIVLGGSCSMQAGGTDYGQVGRRRDVWEKIPPYLLLLPPGTDYTVTVLTDLHLAVAGAPLQVPQAPGAPAGHAPALPARLITPEEMATEHRGEGQTYRYIHHLLPPSAAAARLLLVEVYTPAGNWSSFPGHKHDTEDPPREAYLEETYYHLINPPTGFALQRVYTPDRSLDQALAPGNGDLVLVPQGYHPVAASPGHDLYYLNVMAGPSRAWNFQVDPDYAALMNWQKPPVAGGQKQE